MLRRIRLAQLTMDETCRKIGRPIHIMETCGTHTASIFRNAIRQSIPRQMKILTGPGCSVCVVDTGYLNTLYSIAQRPDIIIAARQDLINVPLTENLDRLSQFKNVHTAASVLDVLQLARTNPDKKIIYAAVGYQTCIPGTAVALEIAQKEALDNFFILPSYKKIDMAMLELVKNKTPQIDAFIVCGNMSALTGVEIYKPLTDQNIPCLPLGIEPMQLIEGIAEICSQLKDEKTQFNYDFSIGVTYQGNQTANDYINKYFTTTDAYWRGIGKISGSGYALKPQYSKFDAFKTFNLSEKPQPDKSGCRCGEIVTGQIEPPQCSMFNTKCNPENPNGPCMASAEGACKIWLKYSPKKN